MVTLHVSQIDTIKRIIVVNTYKRTVFMIACPSPYNISLCTSRIAYVANIIVKIIIVLQNVDFLTLTVGVLKPSCFRFRKRKLIQVKIQMHAIIYTGKRIFGRADGIKIKTVFGSEFTGLSAEAAEKTLHTRTKTSRTEISLRISETSLYFEIRPLTGLTGITDSGSESCT